MLLKEIGYVVESACITADMRMHNTCCACGSQLLYTNYYPDMTHPLFSLLKTKKVLKHWDPRDLGISIILVIEI